MDNTTAELGIKRTDLLPESASAPADLDEILQREINPLIMTMQRDEVQALFPAVLDQYRQQCLSAAAEPEDRSRLNALARLEAQAFMLFFKYAEPQNLALVLNLVQDPNEFVQGRSVHLLVGLLDIEPRKKPETLTRLFEILKRQINAGEDLTLIKESIEAMASINAERFLPTLLKELTSVPFDVGVKNALSMIANSYSLLWTVDALRELAKKAKKPDKRQALEAMLAYLEPEQPKQELVESLRDLYDRINFENYVINENLTEVEAELLEDIFPNKEGALLDLGCGSGRLLKALSTRGFKKLHGLDFVPRHVQVAKEATPDAALVVGNWHNLPYPPEYFRGVYCLGRSFLHNLTLQDQLCTLREAWRVVGKEGKLVLDIPDITVGGYAEEVQRFMSETKAKGVNNFSEGLIYDSPDSVHFYNRFAPTREQITALCELTGFTIEKVVKREVPNGKADMNLYFVLKKNPDFRSESISSKRLYELLMKFAPLSATLPPYLESEDAGLLPKLNQTKLPSSLQSEGV